MNTDNLNPDLLIAHYLLNVENKELSKYIDTAGYHVQQAIEKSIKYFLHNVHGIDDTTRTFKTHNLMNLFHLCTLPLIMSVILHGHGNKSAPRLGRLCK
jgi:hypothetical protein